MNIENQPYAFLVCVLIGATAGVLYEPFGFVHAFIRNRFVRGAADVLFSVAAAVLFLSLSVAFGLPDLRAYMLVAFALGFFVYIESLHRIVAICRKRLYNKCRSCLKKICFRQKAAYERRKIKKGRYGRNGCGGDPVCGSARVLDIPAGIRIRP